MTIVYSTSTLWAPKSDGQKKYWIGHVATDGTDWFTMTTFWHETKNGPSKKQTSAPTRIEGKNIGKANETTPENQAYSELNSLVNKQKDKGYGLEGEEISTIALPMLAHKYQDRKHKVTFPLWGQKKLDGVRMLSNGKDMWSRKGKPMIEACVDHLKFDTKGYTVDGELILPQPYSFQDSISACKKFDPELSPKLQYVIYDIICDLSYCDRLAILNNIIPTSESILLIETKEIASEADLISYHEEMVSEGWEGIMLRSDGNGYEVNKRSNQLLKYKTFDDDEFEVIGVKEGRGKFEGLAILECITKDGAIFEATPKGTVEFKRSLFSNQKEVIGKFWKIQYFGYTTNDDPLLVKPRFPIAIAPREEIEG